MSNLHGYEQQHPFLRYCLTWWRSSTYKFEINIYFVPTTCSLPTSSKTWSITSIWIRRCSKPWENLKLMFTHALWVYSLFDLIWEWDVLMVLSPYLQIWREDDREVVFWFLGYVTELPTEWMAWIKSRIEMGQDCLHWQFVCIKPYEIRRSLKQAAIYAIVEVQIAPARSVQS